MRYKRLDLNLLVPLDALLEEQSITRAAVRINVSQSAISGMLGRLRTYFGDELLVLVGRRMQRTPLGNELVAPIRELLLHIDDTIIFRDKFVPYDEQRHFRIAASDYAAMVLFPALVRRMHILAPNMTFEFVPLLAAPSDIVKDGQTDLVIIPEDCASEAQPQEHLLSDTYCCMAWRGSGSLDEPIDLASFAARGHVASRFNVIQAGALDEKIFRQQGVERRLQVITADFASMAQIVVETDLIATLPTRLATMCAEHYAVRLLPPPVVLPSIRLCMQWHRHFSNDMCHRWLRDELSALARSIV